jgi:hypothetical protein
VTNPAPSTLDALAAAAPAAAPSVVVDVSKATDAVASDAKPADVKPEAPKPSAARERLDAIRARREERSKARADAAAVKAGADPAIVEAANRWRAYEAAEAARVAKEAEALSPEDRALVDGEKDVTRKAALVARLKVAAAAAAPSTPPKVVAKAPPVGAPAGVTSTDHMESIKDAQAMAEAKARDPGGFDKFFSSLLGGNGRQSTLAKARAKAP